VRDPAELDRLLDELAEMLRPHPDLMLAPLKEAYLKALSGNRVVEAPPQKRDRRYLKDTQPREE
jgi:hypothetical protein